MFINFEGETWFAVLHSLHGLAWYHVWDIGQQRAALLWPNKNGLVRARRHSVPGDQWWTLKEGPGSGTGNFRNLHLPRMPRTAGNLGTWGILLHRTKTRYSCKPVSENIIPVKNCVLFSLQKRFGRMVIQVKQVFVAWQVGHGHKMSYTHLGNILRKAIGGASLGSGTVVPIMWLGASNSSSLLSHFF